MNQNTPVFINCPFDRSYKPILDAITFTLLWHNCNPVTSRTRNGADPRLEQICSLIENVNFSIHDLSRMQAQITGELARMNMPFELGLDIGCKRFGGRTDKKLLILDTEQHRYKKALSDLSGNDIFAHNNEPILAVRCVTEWLSDVLNRNLDSYGLVWSKYNEFTGFFHIHLRALKIPKKHIPELKSTYLIKAFLLWRPSGF